MGATDVHAYQKIQGDVESLDVCEDADDDEHHDGRTSTIEKAVLTVMGTLFAITVWMLVRSQGQMPCGDNGPMPFDYGMDY